MELQRCPNFLEYCAVLLELYNCLYYTGIVFQKCSTVNCIDYFKLTFNGKANKSCNEYKMLKGISYDHMINEVLCCHTELEFSKIWPFNEVN